MPNYECNEPAGRGNKKKDKAREKTEKYGKNTVRGVRHMEQIMVKTQKKQNDKK
jgi:hypothetical protein